MTDLRTKKAITLVEILIAVLIISVTVGIILQSYTYHLYLIEVARGISTAVADIRDIIENILNTPANEILTDFPNGVADGGVANDYTVLVGGYTLANQEITVSYTDTGANPLEVICTVTWSDTRNINHSLNLVTFIAR